MIGASEFDVSSLCDPEDISSDSLDDMSLPLLFVQYFQVQFTLKDDLDLMVVVFVSISAGRQRWND